MTKQAIDEIFQRQEKIDDIEAKYQVLSEENREYRLMLKNFEKTEKWSRKRLRSGNRLGLNSDDQVEVR